MHINYDALITDIGCPDCDAPLAYEKATGYWVTQCDHDHALTTVEVEDFRAMYDNPPALHWDRDTEGDYRWTGGNA